MADRTLIRLALFGQPVEHSRSPRIHARFAAQLGLRVDYRAIDCPAGELGPALERFAAQGGHGCNLTVPLKAEGLALAARASEAAQQAGACNTLVRSNNAWIADNTDGAGLLADFNRLGIELAGRRVLIVGAGGAVAGVLGALLARDPATVVIANRNIARAEALAERFAEPGTRIEVRGAGESPGNVPFDLLIQATSLGHSSQSPAIERDWLADDAIAYDLNYGPAHRPFAEWCARSGVSCFDGYGMLVEQAGVAFECFTGQRPDTGLFFIPDAGD